MDAFQANFKGDIVTESSPDYEASIARWASNAVRRAKVVAFVKDAADVALALQYAKSAGLPIAVRSGGHNPAGASSVEGGLVVDLSRYLNKVTVDSDTKLAFVQGGSIWETVDRETIKHGLATVAGVVSHTGVGGLITGGGYGWLTPRHGLAIDNLVRATVVVADGSVLTASETENADLFYGIRGGGSNFGVVTEFVLQCHPQRSTVYAGPIVFTRDQVDGVAKALDEWFKQTTVDEAIHVLYTRDPQTRMPCLAAFLFFNGSEEDGRKTFKPFFDLKPVADMSSEMPFERLNTCLNHTSVPGNRYYMRGCLYNPDTSHCINTRMFDRVAGTSESGALDVSLIFEYVSLAKVNGIDPAKTPYRRDLANNALVLVTWPKDDVTRETEEVRRVAVELCDLVKALSGPVMAYGNYSPDSEALPREGVVAPDKARELFRDSYSKLQQIKRKYDPDVVFNKWFVVTPAAA